MNSNKIFSILITLVIILTGCDYNDKYFDGLDDLSKPTDIKKKDYTLIEADYATIANNATNKALAESRGEKSELEALTKNKTFTETLPATIYIPAFLAAKYNGADNSSAIRVTYNKTTGFADYINELNKTTTYKLTAADYKTIWGENSSTSFFTPSTPAASNIPTILKSNFPEAATGDIKAVDYNVSDNEPSGSVVAINEDFNEIETGEGITVQIDGWHNVTTKGTFSWEGRTYSNNSYLNATANKHVAGELETYMITPGFMVTPGLKLTFDACYGYYKEVGEKLSVLVSTNLAGFTTTDISAAKWDDITTSFHIEIPSGNFGTLAPAGSHNLDTYVGKTIYIALKYNGDSNTGATTTVQVDNLVVKSESSGGGEDKYIATTGLYSFNGTNWAAYSGNTYMLTKADFTSMGINYDNFSGTISADEYLPTFLKLKFPYAKADDTKAVVYKYYANSKTTINADEYQYDGNEWIKNSDIEAVTDQFVKTDGKWMFDPSVTIVLKPGREITESIAYYQPIVDYIKATKGDDYLQARSSGGVYDNAEYYYGASSYQSNMDFRTSAWKNSCKAGATEYMNKSDADLTALMFERLPEAFIPALKANHPDIAPIEGVDVTCTIDFGVYTGTVISNCNYQIKYKVIGKGEFEYIQDSLIELK